MAGETQRIIRIVVDASGAAAGGQRVARSLEDIQHSSEKTASAVESLKHVMHAFFAGLVVDKLREAAGEIIKVTAEFQKLQASLETVMKSSELAKAAFTNIKQFAATTPYSVKEATEAFIKLKALGLDPSIPALRSYGNTASAMGKDLMQFIEAVADAATNEFERLKEFGIKAKKENEEVKFTFDDVTTTVKANAKDIVEYLRKIGDVKFAGAMEKQAQTLGGALSNLKDSWENFLNSLGESGFGEAVAGGARQLSSALDSLSKNMREIADTAIQLGRLLAGLVIARTVAAAFGVLGTVLTGSAGAIVGLRMMAAMSATAAAQMVITGTAAGVLSAALGVLNAAATGLLRLLGGWPGLLVAIGLGLYEMTRNTELSVVATKDSTEAAIKQTEAHLIATGQIKEYTDALFGNAEAQKKNLEARLASLKADQAALQYMASNPTRTNTAEDFARITAALNNAQTAITQTQATLNELNKVKPKAAPEVDQDALDQLEKEAEARKKIREALVVEMLNRTALLGAVRIGDDAVRDLTYDIEAERKIREFAATTEDHSSAAYQQEAEVVKNLAYQVRDLSIAYDKEKDYRDQLNKAIDEGRKARQALEKEYDRAIQRTTDRFVENGADILFDALDGKSGNFWESFVRLGKRAFADLAAEELFRPIAKQMASMVVDSMPAMFGLKSKAALAASGTGGDISGGGDLMTSIKAWLNTPISGGYTAPATAPIAQTSNGMLAGGEGARMVAPAGTTWGQALTGTAQVGSTALAGFGTGMAFGGMAGTAGGSKMLGAAVGGASGALSGMAAGAMIGAAGGPIGALGGAIIGGIAGIVGGMAGTQKGSVGPNAAGELTVRGGRFTLGWSKADNDADINSVRSPIRQASQQLNNLIDKFDLRVASGLEGGKFGFYSGAANQKAGLVTDPTEFIEQTLNKRLLSGRGTTGTILANTQAKTLQELSDDLTFGRQYEKLTRQSSAYQDQLDALADSYADVRERAQSLGLSTEALAMQFEKSRQEMESARNLQLTNLSDELAARRATVSRASGGSLTAMLITQASQTRNEVDSLRKTLKDLGLTEAEVTSRTRDLVAVRQQEADVALENFRIDERNARTSLRARTLRLQGQNLEAQLLEFDTNTMNERVRAAQAGMVDLVELERVQAGERLKVIEDFNQQAAAQAAQAAAQAKQQADQLRNQADDLIAGAANSLTSFIQSIRYGNLSGLTPDQQYDLSRQQFQAVSGAALAGNINSINQFGQYGTAFLEQARTRFGAGAEYAEAYRWVTQIAEQLGTVVGGDAARENAMMIVSAQDRNGQAMVQAIQALQEEVAALRRQVATNSAAPARMAAA
jgi:Tape measure protein